MLNEVGIGPEKILSVADRLRRGKGCPHCYDTGYQGRTGICELLEIDDKVRERLRKIAPEVVFEGGDPGQLPLDTRRTILHEVCEQMASGTSSRSVADYDAVQRFANADLTDDIRSLIGK